MAYYPVPSVRDHDSWTANYQDKYVKGNMAANPPEAVLAKGDLFPATGLHAISRLAVGTNGQTLISDPSQAGGRKWNTSGLVPIGGIVIWSGSVVSIPSGWQLCNGTGGTPDLRDKFILGGNGADTGTTGGATTINLQHSHSLTSPTGSGGSHAHTQGVTGSENAHVHALSGNTSVAPDIDAESSGGSGAAVPAASHTHTISGNTNAGSAHTHTNPNTASGGSHTHTISPVGTNTALSASQATLPPYYALCYIMRMS